MNTHSRLTLGSVALLALAWTGCAAHSSTSPPQSPPSARPAPSAPSVTSAAASSSELITAAGLRAFVDELASDEMRGRETGTPDALRAAERIAQDLRAAGVQPAGDEGGYLQTIDTRGFQLAAVPKLTLRRPDGSEVEALYGVDFAELRGPPLSGSFAVVTVRQAGDIPTPPRADGALLLLGGGRSVGGWLEAAGAPGGAGWGLLIGTGPHTAGEADATPPQGLFSVDGSGVPRGPTRLRLRGPLLAQAGESGLAGVRLELEAAAVTSAANVVGVLRGVGTPEHPELAREAIVLTAHYDHLGVAGAGQRAPHAPAESAAAPSAPPAAPAAADESPAVPDLIYNGADDDASGVAVVLALAQAFGRGPPPARTVVFLIVTGEEVGLLGTEYYLDHPVVPLSDTVANINFEMVGRPDPLAGGAGRLWLTGFEKTSLGPEWNAAGLPIAADARPDEHFYERSDNIAFVRRQVIGQTLSSYNMHTDYHTVADEPDTLDYGHLETAARTAYAACRMLADGTLQPRWSEPSSRPGAHRGGLRLHPIPSAAAR